MGSHGLLGPSGAFGRVDLAAAGVAISGDEQAGAAAPKVFIVRGWAMGGGLTTAAIGFVASAAWSVTGWGDLQVTAPAVEQAASAASAGMPATPDLDPLATAEPGAPTVPACSIADEPTTEDPATDWATVLVDPSRALPSEFAPTDLVDVSAAGFGSGDQIRQIVVPDLDALRQAAQANGTPVVLISGYRSFAYQDGLFTDAVDETGLEVAQLSTAQPGHSEHQLGTAVDLLDRLSSQLDASFAQTPTGQWLAANAHPFGFVISYPDVPRERSCYDFEPWHLRYVGRDIALAVHDSGLTLREWLLTQPQ